jgi:hypothetical protein
MQLHSGAFCAIVVQSCIVLVHGVGIAGMPLYMVPAIGNAASLRHCAASYGHWCHALPCMPIFIIYMSPYTPRGYACG